MFPMVTSMNSSTQLSQLQWTSMPLSFLLFCRSVSIILCFTHGQGMNSSLPEGFLTQLYWNEMFSFPLFQRPKAPGSSMCPYVPDKIVFCTRERAGQRTGMDRQSEKNRMSFVTASIEAERENERHCFIQGKCRKQFFCPTGIVILH